MSQASLCPRCGKPLPPDAPAGLCPTCLIAQGHGGGAPDALQPTTPSPERFTPPEPAELAALFPQLEIVELLGTGGMGAVYKARQPGLDRLVALKILPPELGHDPAFGERFTREARALARLNHPNIVTVYEFGQAPSPRPSPPGGEGGEHGKPGEGATSPLSQGDRGALGEGAGALYYLLMEYIDGTNLRELIGHGKLKPEEALAVVPQICEALQYAHDEGVVHRDIKPENILVDTRGRVKIADFGLAKIAGRPPAGEAAAVGKQWTLTETGQVMGTQHYMAPEQLKGSHQVDHRADIYSLGVVFYEMLTGELPIGRFEPPSKKVQVDVRLDEVVLRALENEPARRYQQASEVKTDVETISSGFRAAADAAGTFDEEAEQSPQQGPPVLSVADRESIETARRQVRGPAIGLTVAGCIGPGLVIFGVVIWVIWSMGHYAFGDGEIGIILTTVFWVSVWGLFIIVGANKMRHLESYGFAMTSAILAVVPSILGPSYLLSLPMGIWALIVLARPGVKDAFRKNATGTGGSFTVGPGQGPVGQSSVPRATGSGRWAGRLVLLATAVVTGVVFALLRPDISDATWSVYGLLVLAAFLVDVVRYRGQRRGLQAAFPLLAGLTAMLIYFVVQPEPLLSWLCQIGGVTAGQDDPTALRVILGLVAAWLVWQMVQVGRRLGRPFIGRLVAMAIMASVLVIIAALSYLYRSGPSPLPSGATATVREIPITEAERGTPGLSVYRYELKVPPGHYAQFSTELWRHGKPEWCGIHLAGGRAGNGRVELRLQQGETLSPEGKGKLRWDWLADTEGARVASGDWIDDPFAGAQGQSSAERTDQWQLTPGKEYTVLILLGWEQPTAVGVPAEYFRAPTDLAEAIEKGEIPRADVELYLKVRLRRTRT